MTIHIIRGRCDYDEVIILHRTDRLGRIALAIVPLHIIRGGIENRGDRVVVRVGNMIPFDGEVCDGEAMVNQSSMTGESAAVRKLLLYLAINTVLVKRLNKFTPARC